MSGPGQLAAFAAAVLALAFTCAAATTSGAAPGCGLQTEKGPDVGNQQEINRSAGDASLVAQSVTPASHGNLQTATTSSPDGSNVVVQTIDGDRNVQAVRQSGRNNVAVQRQAGGCNRQSVRQSGDGNVAVQSQSGRGLSSTLNQRSDQK